MSLPASARAARSSATARASACTCSSFRAAASSSVMCCVFPTDVETAPVTAVRCLEAAAFRSCFSSTSAADHLCNPNVVIPQHKVISFQQHFVFIHSSTAKITIQLQCHRALHNPTFSMQNPTSVVQNQHFYCKIYHFTRRSELSIRRFSCSDDKCSTCVFEPQPSLCAVRRSHLSAGPGQFLI